MFPSQAFKSYQETPPLKSIRHHTRAYVLYVCGASEATAVLLEHDT